MGFPDEPQATYSTKFKQGDVTLFLYKKFKHLPRLRRAPLSGSWQSLFLVLTPEGIEKGAYSTNSIFTASFNTNSWGDEIEIEAWSCYRTIKRIVFVQKNGVEIVKTHKDKPKSDKITIDPKNPIVEIHIY